MSLRLLNETIFFGYPVKCFKVEAKTCDPEFKQTNVLVFNKIDINSLRFFISNLFFVFPCGV